MYSMGWIKYCTDIMYASLWQIIELLPIIYQNIHKCTVWDG